MNKGESISLNIWQKAIQSRSFDLEQEMNGTFHFLWSNILFLADSHDK